MSVEVTCEVEIRERERVRDDDRWIIKVTGNLSRSEKLQARDEIPPELKGLDETPLSPPVLPLLSSIYANTDANNLLTPASASPNKRASGRLLHSGVPSGDGR